MGIKRKLLKVISIMILFTLTNDNCYPLSLKPIKERDKSIKSLVKDLMGARLAAPVFQSIEEAKAYGVANKDNDAVIHELFKLACQYKQLVMTFGMNNKFDNQMNNYLYYKAAWEASRGIGARLSDITNVVAVGVGNGLNLPFLKEYLEKRGFQKVVIQSIDDGWWLEDEDLPRPNKDMRQEIVELADRTLIGRLESDEFRIRYVDLFDALPAEFIDRFEIAFLTPNHKDMSISYVQETLKLLNNHGILVLRLHTGQTISRVDLVNFCEDNDLSIGIYDESVFPNPDMEFQNMMIVIRRAHFNSKQEKSLNQELFERLIGARLTEVMV